MYFLIVDSLLKCNHHIYPCSILFVPGMPSNRPVNGTGFSSNPARTHTVNTGTSFSPSLPGSVQARPDYY